MNYETINQAIQTIFVRLGRKAIALKQLDSLNAKFQAMTPGNMALSDRVLMRARNPEQKEFHKLFELRDRVLYIRKLPKQKKPILKRWVKGV